MRWRLIVVGALLTVLLLIHITSLHHKELTTDEPLHYHYGYRVLHGTPRRTGAIDSSTMPFSGVHAMTSGTLAVIARTTGIPADMSPSGQVRYRCSFAIAGVVCVEMELRTLRP